MSPPIEILAILFPKAGKTDRVVELLNEVSLYIKDNEPGTLKYEIVRQVNKKSGDDEVIMVESYKDKASLGVHGSSAAFQAIQKKLKDEDLIAAPMSLKFMRAAGGFSRL